MSPGTALACMFPPSEGLRGACTIIADLRYASPRPLWGGKREAVRLIVATAMDRACGFGHGNRAKRRAKSIYA